jgi:hypothetical protein
MFSSAESILAYIKAKDGNRPHLLDAAFTEDAVLQMHVQAESISFPSSCVGREAIAETLVRRFNQTYENIYTFCIGIQPQTDAESLSCHWLVAMSEKQNGAVRIGCGRYDWSFTRTKRQVCSLVITIDAMETLPPETLVHIMSWASRLPYPWCTQQQITVAPPNIPTVLRVLQFLR